MNDEANTVQREKRHAALYFSPKNSAAFKELAARIRSDGGRTTLIWSQQWQGAESILTEARAIVIEQGCKNADAIVEAYRRYSIDVEIHFADENGEFAEDSMPDPANDVITDEQAAATLAASLADAGLIDESDDPVVTDEQAAETLASCMEDTTDEKEHTDPDTTTDAIVEAKEDGAGEDPVDPDSDSEDAGTADASGEAGAEEPVDTGRTARD